MSSSKPDIELVLDVRSYERVVVISNSDSYDAYPRHWSRPNGHEDMRASVVSESVVVIDGVEVTPRVISAIGELRPRLVAIVSSNDEHARSIRKSVGMLYPWAEFWTTPSSLGRLVVTKDVVGRPYDRDRLVDMRGGATA